MASRVHQFLGEHMYRFKRHTIYVTEPYIQSYAQSVLLRWQLNKSAGETVRIWLRFRKWWLKQQGKLVCHYCGRKGLKKSVRTREEEETKLATIDHVHPLSKGGERYKDYNLVVACWPCNQKKGDDILG